MPAFSQIAAATSAVAAAFTMVACQTATPPTGNTPPVVPVSGKLTDGEAAKIALTNNGTFRELATDLGIAEADLIQANELPNPGLSVLFPLGPKQLEFTAKLPVETLWLRPKRVAIAKLNTEAIAKRLLQDGLDLVRDVKIACTDLRLAERKVELAREESDLLKRFAELANARLEAGDISELEATSAKTDALRAKINQDRAPHLAKLAHEKLRNLLGVSNASADFTLAPAPNLPTKSQGEDSLLKKAFAARPDLRAAELAIETEAKRFGLAQAEVYKLTAILDANGDASNFEAGPGIDFTLPIFNRGQGAKAIANAKFQKAVAHYTTARDQIALDVRQALIRYRQAEKDLGRLREELLPALKQTIEQTERAWEGGEVTYLFVLESIRQFQSARLTEAESIAEWHRAAAELERAVGTTAASGK